MQKLFIYLLLLAVPAERQDNQIDWSATRKLTWHDFRGKPDANNLNAALTSSHINFSFGYGEDGFHWNIQCRFDPARSWVRTRSDYILAHEQGHFDIAEIFARRLEKAVKAYHFNESGPNKELNDIYDRVVKAHHAYQALYDKETDHSRKKDAQKLWEQKIAGELHELAPYADYR